MGLSVALAGALATSNLFGYLVGASLAMHPITHGMRLAIVRWSLVGVVVTTALMAGPPSLWIALRFVTGVCSGSVFVFASSIVLSAPRPNDNPPGPRSSSPAWASASRFPAWQFRHWRGSGLTRPGSVLPSSERSRCSRPSGGSPKAHRPRRCRSKYRSSTAETPHDLCVAVHYLCCRSVCLHHSGDVPGRYHRQDSGAFAVRSADLGLCRLAAAFATFGWIPAAARLGKARALALALALQCIGIAAPVFSHNAFAVILAGVALGGTFIAITLFTTGLGRDIFPRKRVPQ